MGNIHHIQFRVALVAAAVLFAVAGVNDAFAQDAQPADSTVRVVLGDGTTHIGVIVSDTDSEIVLRTNAGVRITIPRAQIRSIVAVAQEPGRGRFRRIDPNRTRLFFASTARPLGHGNGYVSLYEILFPFAAVGVGNVATLAGGFSLVPGASEQLLYAAPKMTVLNHRNTSVALGGFAATLTGSSGYGGIVYGVVTQGSPVAAVTGGVGFLFGEGEFVDTPIILVGGEYQLSNSMKLLSENYFIPEIDGGVLLSGGLRFMGDNLSADFGLFTSPEAFGEGFPFIPWIGFSYQWN